MKILKRSIAWLLAALAAVVLFIAVSILVDVWVGRDRISAVTNTLIPGNEGQPDLLAYVAVPPGQGPYPVVILIHEFFGLNESIVGKADGLAEEGYLVIAPDTFRGSTTSWIPRAIYQVISTPSERVNQDLDSVYAWVETEPTADAGRVAIVGFCYGGRTALHYSLHNNRLAATVIFYGSPVTDPEVLSALPGPILGIFGGADRSIPVEDVELFQAALVEAGIPNEVTVYEDQPHAFVTDIESIRAGGVQGQAWEQMLSFLSKYLLQRGDEPNSRPALGFHPSFDWGYYLVLAFEHAFGITSHRSGH